MIHLYEPPGTFLTDVDLLPDEMPEVQVRGLLAKARRLLDARGEKRAANVLASVPFRVVAATNSNCDDFSVLLATVPLAQYERLRRATEESDGCQAFRAISQTLDELGAYVRFISAELAAQTPADAAQAARALTPLEIKQLVQKWIGVAAGYLGDFSYASHEEFYADLGLAIDPNSYPGTTRSRFMQILAESPPDVQAKILEGILTKYPIGSPAPGNASRTPEMHAEIRGWITRLRGTAPVITPVLGVTSAVVERALADVEELLAKNGPTSCVDRVHTALHGYVREVCNAQGLTAPEDATLPYLLKVLREQHPAFRGVGPRQDDVAAVLKSLGAIVDKLNPLRNNASVAHPNPELLAPAEAMLVVNVVRTILHYFDAKLAAATSNTSAPKLIVRSDAGRK